MKPVPGAKNDGDSPTEKGEGEVRRQFHLAVLSLQNPLLPFSLLGTLSLGQLFQATAQCPVVTFAHPFVGNRL